MKRKIRMSGLAALCAALALALAEPGSSQNSARSCGMSGTVRERLADCAVSMEARVARATHRWRLVARTSNSMEVWRDEQTGYLWSDVFERMTNYQASELCGAPGMRDETGYLVAEEALWRLPSRSEFEAADSHGMRQVLPHLTDKRFWTTIEHVSGYFAHDAASGFDGNTGEFHPAPTSDFHTNAARCLGVGL